MSRAKKIEKGFKILCKNCLSFFEIDRSDFYWYKQEEEYYSDSGIELTCPHCNNKWEG